jgi:hypothetical protein
MEIEIDDRLPVWHLCKSANMPRSELMPLLDRLGMTVELDRASGNIYASRTEFADLLRSMAEGAL